MRVFTWPPIKPDNRFMLDSTKDTRNTYTRLAIARIRKGYLMRIDFQILTLLFVQVAISCPAWAQEPGGIDEPISLSNVDKVGLLSETKHSTRQIKPGPGPNELLLFPSKGIIVVNENSLKLLRKIEPRQVVGFTFSRDQSLTGWLEGKTLFIREEKTGRTIEIEAGDRPIGAAFSPDNKVVAVGDMMILPRSEGAGSNLLRIIDAATGKLIKKLDINRDGYGALTLVFSPDGKTLAVGNRNYQTKLIDTETWTLKHTLPKQMTHGIEFSPDGKKLAAAYVDGSFAVWDVESGENVKTVDTGCAEIYSVSWNSTGDLLATCGTAGTRLSPEKKYVSKPGYVQLWDAKTFKLAKELMDVRWAHSVRFTRDSKRLMSIVTKKRTMDDSPRIVIWSTGAATTKNIKPSPVIASQIPVAQSLDLPEVPAPIIALSPDGKQVISALRREYKIGRWDFASGERDLVFDDKHGWQIWQVAFNPDGSTVATASLDKTGKLWNAKTGKLIATLEGHNHRVKYVTYSQSGKYVLTASGRQYPYEKQEVVTARIWNGKTGEFVSEFRNHVDNVKMARFNADETLVLTGSDDHTARLWEVKTGKEMHALKIGSRVSSIEFSPDGKTILTASTGEPSSYLMSLKKAKRDAKPAVTMWDASTGRQVLNIPHLQSANASFNESGDQIVTACRGLITYFDTVSGKELRTLRTPLIGTQVTFSPNRKFFVVHEPEKALELWNLSSQKPVGRLAIEKPYSKFFSADDSMFYSLSRGGEFHSWSMEGLD